MAWISGVLDIALFGVVVLGIDALVLEFLDTDVIGYWFLGV